MKTRILTTLTLTTVLLGGAGIVGAAQPELRAPSKQTQIQPRHVPQGIIRSMNPCPKGWRMTDGSAKSSFVCEPKPVAPLNCPPDTHFVDHGCWIACEQTVY